MTKYFKYLASFNLMSIIDKKLLSNISIGNEENLSDDDRGFGKLYKWRHFQRGFDEAKENGKPIFLVIHRAGCPACIYLKEKFSKSVQLLDMSSNFVMMNVPGESDVINQGKKFEPDGKYVPRILFFTSQGEFISEAYNRQNNDSNFRYFYGSPAEVVEVMRFVVEKYGSNRKT